MPKIQRVIDLKKLLDKKSFFLFGPRATGKTFLIKQTFDQEACVINLLRTDVFMRLRSQPHQLSEMISASGNPAYVIIDEVQKVPELLNEVHRLIEEQQITFLLTGSSARKLKQQGVNLLAGRAWEAKLFPLTYSEMNEFNLDHFLRYGSLPPVYLSDDPEEELDAYVNTYLKEEIQAEAAVRKLSAFTRFIQFAALTSGEMLNFSSISNETGVPVSTVREYYGILEDTFLGFMVKGWTKTKKRKPISTAKFYLFDIGVRNTLAQYKHIEPQTDLYGTSFEHFIALELRAYLSYRRLKLDLSYWRSVHGSEVDFIVGDKIAIEVKTTRNVHNKHTKTLRQLQEEKICSQYYLISHDKIDRISDDIHIIYWKHFLDKLWSDEIV